MGSPKIKEDLHLYEGFFLAIVNPNEYFSLSVYFGMFEEEVNFIVNNGFWAIPRRIVDYCLFKKHLPHSHIDS